MLKAFREIEEWVDYDEICLRLNLKIIVWTLKSDSNVLRLQKCLNDEYIPFKSKFSQFKRPLIHGCSKISDPSIKKLSTVVV